LARLEPVSLREATASPSVACMRKVPLLASLEHDGLAGRRLPLWVVVTRLAADRRIQARDSLRMFPFRKLAKKYESVESIASHKMRAGIVVFFCRTAR